MGNRESPRLHKRAPFANQRYAIAHINRFGLGTASCPQTARVLSSLTKKLVNIKSSPFWCISARHCFRTCWWLIGGHAQQVIIGGLGLVISVNQCWVIGARVDWPLVVPREVVRQTPEMNVRDVLPIFQENFHHIRPLFAYLRLNPGWKAFCVRIQGRLLLLHKYKSALKAAYVSHASFHHICHCSIQTATTIKTAKRVSIATIEQSIPEGNPQNLCFGSSSRHQAGR